MCTCIRSPYLSGVRPATPAVGGIVTHADPRLSLVEGGSALTEADLAVQALEERLLEGFVFLGPDNSHRVQEQQHGHEQ